MLAWALEHASNLAARRCATEPYAPNTLLAHERLAPLGVTVLRARSDGALPVAAGSFELVSSRHPVAVDWHEVARVLAPGGTYLSQQIGAATNHALSAFFLGPFRPSPARSPQRAVAAAGAAGLQVVDLREAVLEVRFLDVAAVVVFLRKVIWTVPGFDVDTYRDRLRAMHELIEREGAFVCHSRRFLIEARRPVEPAAPAGDAGPRSRRARDARCASMTA